MHPPCRLSRVLTLLLLGCLSFYGCATNSVTGSSGELIPVSRAQEVYHLAALDKVEFLLADGTPQTFKLDPQGRLDIPPDVHLSLLGVTPGEAETRLHKALPHISQIRWTEFRENSVSVLGEVYNQTKVDLGGAPLRVLDAVAAAGGFTPLADSKNVTLVRRNAGQTEVYLLNLEAATQGQAPQFNMLLQPGDVLTVHRGLL